MKPKKNNVKNEEEDSKEGVVLSDSVLDALVDEEATPIDPLLAKEDEELLPIEEDDEEDIFDSGDYKNPDGW